MTDLARIFADEDRRMREEEERTTLRTDLVLDESNPDAVAAARRDARRLGVTDLEVRQSPLLARTAQAERDMETLDATPALRAWLAKPGNVELARDDVEPLSFVERTLRGAGRVADEIRRDPLLLVGAGRRMREAVAPGGELRRAVEAPYHTYRAGELSVREGQILSRFQQAARGQHQLSAEDFRELIDVRRRAETQRELGLSPGVGADIVGMLPSVVGGLLAGPQLASEYAAQPWSGLFNDTNAESFRQDPVGSGVAAAATLPIYTLASTLAGVGGFLEGGAKFTYEVESGHAFQRYMNLRTVDGKPIDPRIAAEAAHLAGQINAGVEYVGGASLVGGVKATSNMLGRAERAAAREAIDRLVVSEVMKKYGLRVAAGGAGEGAEEIVQGMVVSGLEATAKERDGGNFAPTDHMADLRQSAYEGLLAFGMGGAGSAIIMAPSVRDDLEAVRVANANAQTITRLSEAAAKSRLRNRDPDAFADAVQKMSGDAVVLVDADALTTLSQELGLTADEIQKETGISFDAIDEARAGTGFVPVPLGQYLGRIQKTSLGQSLGDHIAFDPGQMTPAQARTMQTELEAQVADVIKAAKGNEQQSEQMQAVLDDVKKQLDLIKKTGGYTGNVNTIMAEFFARAFGTMATRADMNIADAWKRFRPQIIGMAREEAGLSPEVTPLDEVLARAPAGVPRDRVRVARPKADAAVVSAAPVAVGASVDIGNGNTLTAKEPSMQVTNEAGDTWLVRADIFQNTYIDAGGGKFRKNPDAAVGYYPLEADAMIDTLEGAVQGRAGDMVMIGSVGEMWPMGAEKFRARYDVEETPEEIVDGLIFEQAKALGYEGRDTGEAREWVDAVRKGLDMSTEARMSRARAMGFTTKAFRGIRRAHEDRRSDVIWASAMAETAGGYAKGTGGNMMPVLLRLGRSAKVNAGGRMWDTLAPEMIGDAALRRQVDRDFGPVFDTEDVMIKARHMGSLDSVTFENLRDPAIGEALDARDSVPPDTVYGLLDPSGMRSVHAAFDPDRAGEANVLAQFAGVRALTADRSALQNAKSRIKRGESADAVRKDTGWFVGKDKKWRFEIDDSTASFDVSYLRSHGEAVLSGVLTHPALFEAYPALMTLMVRLQPLKEGTNAQIDTDGITLSSIRTDAQIKSSLLHELQHGIQKIEGFDAGGNLMSGIMSDIINGPNAALAKAFKEELRQAENRGGFDAQFAKLVASENVYRRLLGEQEARLTQERAAMSAGERANAAPDLEPDGIRNPQDPTPRNAAEAFAQHFAMFAKTTPWWAWLAMGQGLWSIPNLILILTQNDIYIPGMDTSARAETFNQITRAERFSDPRLGAQENKAVEMLLNGASRDEIADELDVSREHLRQLFHRVRRKAPDVEIPKGRDGQPRSAMNRILPLLRKGLPVPIIAERLGMNPSQVYVARERLMRQGEIGGETFNQDLPGERAMPSSQPRNIEAEMEVAKAIREAGACAAASGAAVPAGAVELMVGNAIGAAIAAPVSIAAAPMLMNLNAQNPPARLKLRKPVETPVWTPEEATAPGPILEPGRRHIGVDMSGEDTGGKSRLEGGKYVPPGGTTE